MYNIKLYANEANLTDMLTIHKTGVVQGFTTNPTLLRKAGVTDYEAFAREVLAKIPDLPISFQVFADEFDLMYQQASKITHWGENVYVKIPIINTQGESAISLIKRLGEDGVKLNITAISTLAQVQLVNHVLNSNVPSIVSVFAGRIADTGRDPVPIMKQAAQILKEKSQAELLWASTRELLNIYQAEECGCHIITLGKDIIKKLKLKGKDLTELSRENVQMFYDDACKANLQI
jgi:transaldolase